MPCPNSARKRRVTVAFRCSPELSKKIDRLVAMSGMTKQDYITKRLTDCKIEAEPNVRLYKGLGDAAKSIYLELRRIHDASELDEMTVETMNSFADILKDLGSFDKNEMSPTTVEEFDMMNLARE